MYLWFIKHHQEPTYLELNFYLASPLKQLCRYLKYQHSEVKISCAKKQRNFIQERGTSKRPRVGLQMKFHKTGFELDS